MAGDEIYDGAEERHQRNDPRTSTERRSGLERRRGPGRRRGEDRRAAEEGEITVPTTLNTETKSVFSK